MAAVPGQVLLRMAEAVVPHAAAEAYAPGLCAVQWEVRDGALWLAATDTTTIAAARCPAGGYSTDAGPVLLPVSGTLRLAQAAAAAGGAAALVSIDAQALTVTLRAGNGRREEARWPLLPGRHEVPDWRQVLGGLLAGPAAADRVMVADAVQLCRFHVRSALAAQVAGGWPARLRLEPRRHAVTGARALLVLCEDWFAGAILTPGGYTQAPASAGAGEWARWLAGGTPAGEGSA